MSPAPRRSFVKIYAPMIMPLLFLTLVIVGGWLTWKWMVGGPTELNPNKGKVPVPATRVDVQAYTKITRDHLRVLYLDPSKLPESVFLTFPEVIGRVLAKDKKAQYVFTEKDFLEKGAREGIAGALPPGKRAFTIETETVQGLYGLHRGDKFDLMGIFTIKSDSNFQVVGGTTSMNQPIAEPTLIARRAQILIPKRTRQETYSQTSLTQGTRIRARPIIETVIAVTPTEVQALAQAMSMEAELYVVPVSDNVADNTGVESDASDGSLFSKLNVVETLKGGKRTRVAVPSSKT